MSEINPGDFSFLPIDNLDVVSGVPREVVRIHPDGTFKVVPDVTPEEAKKVLVDLTKFAAEQYKKARECDQNHKS